MLIVTRAVFLMVPDRGVTANQVASSVIVQPSGLLLFFEKITVWLGGFEPPSRPVKFKLVGLTWKACASGAAERMKLMRLTRNRMP